MYVYIHIYIYSENITVSELVEGKVCRKCWIFRCENAALLQIVLRTNPTTVHPDARKREREEYVFLHTYYTHFDIYVYIYI